MTTSPASARHHGQRRRKLGLIVLLMLVMASTSMLVPSASSGRPPLRFVLATEDAANLVRTEPENLTEELTLEEAQGGAGTRIMQGEINDPADPEDQWAKMQHVHVGPDGTNTVVHHWQNLETGGLEGFKFK